MDFNKDYYKILGVEKNASEDEIKKAFRKLSLEWHPDKHSGDSEEDKKKAEEKFKEISEAYDVLKDKKTRSQYDAGPDTGFSGGGFGGWDPFGGFGGHKEFHQPGKNVVIQCNVTWDDIKNGGIKNREFKYFVNKRCHSCGGSGGTTEVCPDCRGTGMIVDRKIQGHTLIQSQHPCMKCHGTGKRILKYCNHCHGSGLERIQESYTVDLPLMYIIADGQTIDAGPLGSESPDPDGQRGSLYISINHKLPEGISITVDFSGANIINNIKIPYYDFILGTKHQIETPEGKKLDVTIKPGVTKLRVPGKGINVQGIKGDYYINVSLNTDDLKNISKDEKKLLEKIKELHK